MKGALEIKLRGSGQRRELLWDDILWRLWGGRRCVPSRTPAGHHRLQLVRSIRDLEFVYQLCLSAGTEHERGSDNLDPGWTRHHREREYNNSCCARAEGQPGLLQCRFIALIVTEVFLVIA